jgi:transcriptional regulator with XRE-family HTH domain
MRFKDNTPLDSKLLGSRVRQARERLGLSQEEFAALVSKDQGAISEYENGKRRISAVDLPTFAQVLNVPLLYFYEGEIGVHDLERAMLQEFQYLPSSEAKQAVIEIIRILTNTLYSSVP